MSNRSCHIPSSSHRRSFHSVILCLMMLVLSLFQLSHWMTDAKVIQLQYLSRHCDRTPVSNETILSDPIDWEKQLNLPNGELTGLGMRQCFKMGQTLKARYLGDEEKNAAHFISGISKSYHALDYKFYSSDIDRTLLSAWSTSMGLFEKNGPNNDIDNQPALPESMQPIPVHEIAKQHDNILRGYDKCKKATQWQTEYLASEEFKKIEDEHLEFIKEMSVAAGYSETEFTLANFYRLYDLVVVQHAHKLLSNQKLLDNYDKIVKVGDLSMTSGYNRKTMGNLAGGPSLKLILGYLESMVEADKSNSKFKPYKFIQYSGHDTSILSTMSALNLMEDYEELRIVPPYGSQLLFELHKDGAEDYAVQVVIRYGYDGEFKPYALKSVGGGCDGQVKCPIDKFAEILRRDGFPSNWCKECGNTEKDTCVKELLADKTLETVILYVTIPFLVGLNAVVFTILIAYVIKTRFFSNRTKIQYDEQLP